MLSLFESKSNLFTSSSVDWTDGKVLGAGSDESTLASCFETSDDEREQQSTANSSSANICDGIKPSSATIAATESSGKSVRFSSEIEYFEIKPLEYYKSNSSLWKKLWYNEVDYCKIREQNMRIAIKFLNGKLSERGGEANTFRGLERHNTEDFDKRIEMADLSVTMVLKEQWKQKQKKMQDPDAIANIYNKSGSGACQARALLLARRDYLASMQCNNAAVGCPIRREYYNHNGDLDDDAPDDFFDEFANQEKKSKSRGRRTSVSMYVEKAGSGIRKMLST